MEEPQNPRYETCLRLFIQHNGKNLSLIEREMRALGYSDFNRRILYGRKEEGKYKPGWIEKFGWKRLVNTAQHGSPPYEGGVDARGFCGQTGWFSRPPQQVDAIDVESATRREPPRRQKTPTPNSPPGLRRGGRGFARPGWSGKEGSFEAWLKQVSPEMTWDWKYQKYIYRHLQRITTGESKRLMIFLPPRHGKSELVTVRYAGWRLWNDPKIRIIVSSYNQRLADKFSRSIRKLLSEEEDKRACASSPPYEGGVAAPVFQGADGVVLSWRGSRHESDASHHSQIANRNSQITRMFPPSRKINAASQWETAVGGGVKAVGVGAGVTGFGAQLIIIDDPVKNRAEAESETYREKVWDWYRNDLYTRLEPNASIVLIQTRWHEDDLSGRLLREMQDGGDQWEVINLPALSEPRAVATGLSSTAETQRRGEEGEDLISRSNPTLSEITHPPSNPLRLRDSAVKNPADPLDRPVGAALCPERFDEKALDEIRRQLGGYAFSALYQQRPTPAEGGIFKRAWFRRFVDRAPEGLTWKRGYDLAVSTKTSACYTSSFRVAYDELGNLYIADGFRRRIEFPEQRRYIVSRLIEEKDTEHGIEKALHGQAIIQDLRREPSIRGSILKGVTVTADKLTRALKWAPLAEEGKVILVRGPWNQAFLDEICSFPGGQFDDQVDAVSLAVAMFENKGGKLFTF